MVPACVRCPCAKKRSYDECRLLSLTEPNSALVPQLGREGGREREKERMKERDVDIDRTRKREIPKKRNSRRYLCRCIGEHTAAKLHLSRN